jgi:hypothetical protein
MLQRVLTGLLVSTAFAVSALAADGPIYTDQGTKWDAVKRADFYTRDQGARMIPLPWLRALKQANGQPFLADSLARYGYLPNPDNSSGLPVGFTASGPTGAEIAGMTCSACHTRQITAEGKTYPHGPRQSGRRDTGQRRNVPAFCRYRAWVFDA